MRSQSAIGVTTRWATILLVLSAWLLLSNHCALGFSGGPKAEGKTDGCPMHSAPAKEKPATNLLCCKTLRAIAPQAGVKSGAFASIHAVPVQDYVTTPLASVPRLSLQLHARDTGPPHLRTFAETVLQRSILAHAPPASLTKV